MFNISVITTGLLDYQNKQAKFLKKLFLFVLLFAIFFLLLTAVMTVWLNSGILAILYHYFNVCLSQSDVSDLPQ